jgi:hypothetical protein
MLRVQNHFAVENGWCKQTSICIPTVHAGAGGALCIWAIFALEMEQLAFNSKFFSA